MIYVEVILGNPTNDPLGQIVLEDGTRLSDHPYVLIPSTRRGRNYYAAWIWRDDVRESLSLRPNNTTRSTLKNAENVWRTLTDARYGFGSEWRYKSNPSGLSDQFNCHYYFANDQYDWNIEYSGPNIGFWRTVGFKCIPN